MLIAITVAATRYTWATLQIRMSRIYIFGADLMSMRIDIIFTNNRRPGRSQVPATRRWQGDKRQGGYGGKGSDWPPQLPVGIRGRFVSGPGSGQREESGHARLVVGHDDAHRGGSTQFRERGKLLRHLRLVFIQEQGADQTGAATTFVNVGVRPGHITGKQILGAVRHGHKDPLGA